MGQGGDEEGETRREEEGEWEEDGEGGKGRRRERRYTGKIIACELNISNSQSCCSLQALAVTSYKSKLTPHCTMSR